jgi:hypothetical protein
MIRAAVSPLHFRVRGASNFVHDIHFLSSYLHDGRFLAKSVIQRGKTLRIDIDRVCWELPMVKLPKSHDLYIVKARLTISPIASVDWEINDLKCLEDELSIENIYFGAAHWETTPESTEIVISALYGGWKIRVLIDDEFGKIRLDDLETPYLYSQKQT